ncbi:MAG: GNAT family N-acetyltransferase [Proteobacteria bacterium]|nr:GNAT family N-acetyltransferase [Pseudomonadota bacterium]MCP4915766.1 GNAT family N-acetyltransferase [Pseudomonadota bacterium]
MPSIRVHTALSEIPRAAWNALLSENASAFLDWEWLEGLEETGCVGPDAGWHPHHVAVYEDERLVAAAPAYVKTNSMGEFVYDWSWAHAARQMGKNYYPKLIVGVPFTPVTGQRLLVADDYPRDVGIRALVAGFQEIARQLPCHGIHILFNQETEAQELEGVGAATRLQFQFHWENREYADFEGFLASLRSKRRGEIRRERRRLGESGVRVHVREGAGITSADLAVMQGFYQEACRKFGGRAYLNPDFWELLPDRMGSRLHLVQALDGDKPIAGTLNIQKGNRLYGRYWGCSEERKYLHFEVAYYTAVEHCIERGLEVFEPGHGGGHKYVRGFQPTLCHSSHWLMDPAFDRAIRDFLGRESDAVRERVAELSR